MLDKNQNIGNIGRYVLNDEDGNFYIANKEFTKAKTLDQFVQGLDGQKLYKRNSWEYHLESRNGLKLTHAFPAFCETIADLYKKQEVYRKTHQQQNKTDELLNF